ncbi:(4Fe-4S)-binding protein [Reichenbachiella ulvae]|uniref:(4Fe-4S)-binding protein n=1 Tax=Reichenbachiella ulvae TaxID=2980104 RepID=A0ABT3CYL6_9BACT|nr:(4Fe-4S)-binding protein [Reichenbachiella ulvae]MCV9388795.1 (4Fe-4S)-binding protein [Reichenbachiella ulvae]
MATKHYSNDEITVKWQSELCIHSAKCFNGLKEVFDPRARPWVNMEGSSSEKIISQVHQCPSGALSIVDDQLAQKPTQANQTKVVCKPNGPLLIHGAITIEHEGSQTEKDNITALCRCGASKNKPFCDGSHSKVGFEG